MLLFEVIGNLGADARVENSNGRNFVSFNVADSQRWTDANGNAHDITQWVSCAMDGDGGKLLEHLKKGRLVYVVGYGSTRVYSSPKTRRMEAGLNVSVLRVELLGGALDDVPKVLYNEDGVAFNTFKSYYVSQDQLNELNIKKDEFAILVTPDGKQFSVNQYGWVNRMTEQATQGTDIADVKAKGESNA